jgi:hypothetical protein
VLSRPQKKALGVVAGIGHVYADRESPIGNGHDNGEVSPKFRHPALCQREIPIARDYARLRCSTLKSVALDVTALRRQMADSDFQDDNDDTCSACGGSGELLCCDGCYRSFHFKCLDPPLDSDNPPEDDWFCAICAAKKNPPVRHSRSLFSSLFDNLERKNPFSFRLPASIRDYFEGVRTADGGEYEDTVPQKSRSVEPDVRKSL